MTDNAITTLGKFFHQSKVQYRVFDMGRRVVKLSAEEFVGFENGTKPYPYPLKKQALFGIVFWHPEHEDMRYVWFLSLPLDEQGLLVQAARDSFLVMVLERVGECMLAAENGNNIEGALKDSPYTFVPAEHKMASFNAQVTKNLNLPASSFYESALAYFTGVTDKDDWQTLGMQGVADVACRSDDNETALSLIEVLPSMPREPFINFCSFLENAEPAAGIVETLALQLERDLQEKQPDIARICACLRGVSNSPVHGQVELLIKSVLNHPCGRNIEVLATISGRAWRVLTNDYMCELFVEQLAHNDVGQEGFNQLLADVMYLPEMRGHVMKVLRSPTRSDELSRAAGKIFA